MDVRKPMIQSFDCGNCRISYEAPSPGCPLCRSTREVNDLRQALLDAQGQLRILHDELGNAKRDSDVLHNMVEAAKMLGDDDRAFFKTVLYQWRDGKRIGALKVQHGGDKQSPIGFIVSPRAGDPYGHRCTSMGGLAIASLYEEAARATGPAVAMQTLARGLQTLLPGGSVAE